MTDSDPARSEALANLVRHAEEHDLYSKTATPLGERPPVEFHRTTRVLVYTVVFLGLILAVGVVWYVITDVLR